MTTDRGTAIALAHNLQRLMDQHKLSQAELARKTGVAQRTLSTILNIKRPLEINPESITIERLALFFGIPSWQILIPDLPIELLQSPRLTKLIENYRDAPEVGRATVDRISESEVRYSVVHQKITGNTR